MFFNLGTPTSRTIILKSLVNKAPGPVVAKLFLVIYTYAQKARVFLKASIFLCKARR
jgi:hypothetical protein